MDLVALEEIRQVKYRYLRCVDLKLWDDLAEVFTPDATVDYGTMVYGQPLTLGRRDLVVRGHRDRHRAPGGDQGRGVLPGPLPARRGRPLADRAHRVRAYLRGHAVPG